MWSIQPPPKPSSRWDLRQNEHVILLTAVRAGSDDLVTIEVTLGEFMKLSPVEYPSSSRRRGSNHAGPRPRQSTTILARSRALILTTRTGRIGSSSPPFRLAAQRLPRLKSRFHTGLASVQFNT